jgi:hypothetical protein
MLAGHYLLLFSNLGPYMLILMNLYVVITFAVKDFGLYGIIAVITVAMVM